MDGDGGRFNFLERPRSFDRPKEVEAGLASVAEAFREEAACFLLEDDNEEATAARGADFACPEVLDSNASFSSTTVAVAATTPISSSSSSSSVKTESTRARRPVGLWKSLVLREEAGGGRTSRTGGGGSGDKEALLPLPPLIGIVSSFCALWEEEALCLLDRRCFDECRECERVVEDLSSSPDLVIGAELVEVCNRGSRGGSEGKVDDWPES